MYRYKLSVHDFQTVSLITQDFLDCANNDIVGD